MFLPNSELIEKLISVNKVSKTVKGGKNFSFTALVVLGDGNGRVGFGKGNAKEVMDAKNKAVQSAKKNVIKVPLKEGRTIHYDLQAKYSSSKLIIRSAPAGTGIISGSVMRAIFESLGLKDIVAKSIGSNNPHNLTRVTFKALSSIVSPKTISHYRSKDISEIVKKRNFLLS